MRRKALMIGKLDREKRSGVRDQKKNDLGRGWRGDERARALDSRKYGCWPLAVVAGAGLGWERVFVVTWAITGTDWGIQRGAEVAASIGGPKS
jgi:hypothetical protein